MKSKLVRDNIPKMILAKGGLPATSRAYRHEMPDLLVDKIIEEAEEFRKSLSIEEMADMCEALKSLREFMGFKALEVEQARKAKAKSNGRFKRRTILHYVE